MASYASIHTGFLTQDTHAFLTQDTGFLTQDKALQDKKLVASDQSSRQLHVPCPPNSHSASSMQQMLFCLPPPRALLFLASPAPRIHLHRRLPTCPQQKPILLTRHIQSNVEMQTSSPDLRGSPDLTSVHNIVEICCSTRIAFTTQSSASLHLSAATLFLL